MKLHFDEDEAAALTELIDALIKARVEHAVMNRHQHEYPSSESDISIAFTDLQNFLEGWRIVNKEGK